MTVVINKAQFPKFVHEMAHTRSRRADHLRQCLLADFRYNWIRPTFFAEIRQKQKDPCQPFLSALIEGVSQLCKALGQIATLPGSATLRREQIRLQVVLANALMHVKDYGVILERSLLTRGRRVFGRGIIASLQARQSFEIL